MALDIFKAFRETPPDLDFIWPGYLAGTVGALVAPGATGKSFLALQAAMSVACREGGDLVNFQPQKKGKVVFLAGEDPESALQQRIHAIGAHLTPQEKESIAENLMIEPIMGKQWNVTKDTHLKRLIEYASDSRLIVLDTLSRIHNLDENSNGDMSALISKLEHVAASTGASVLFLHHISKNSAKEETGHQQQAARGASALTDNARWCAYVSRMTEKESQNLSDTPNGPPIDADRTLYVRYGVSKQNYGAMPHQQWYMRSHGGVLVPVKLSNAKKRNPTKNAKGDFND